MSLDTFMIVGSEMLKSISIVFFFKIAPLLLWQVIKNPNLGQVNQNTLPAGYGVRSDGKILFINASTCDINYLPCNPPVVFDVTIPPAQL